MTRNPTARRVHREDSAPDDVFVAGVLETTAWAKQHSRKLIIGGIVAAVLLVSIVLFLQGRADRREQAAAQLTQVRAVALSGNTALAISELEQFLTRFGGTPAESEARLLLGRAYMQNAQPQETIEAVQPLARDVDSDMGTNAAFLLAAAHEAAGNPEQAEQAYLRVAEDARFRFQRQDALDNAARIRLATGDAQGALEIYERLLEMTPADAAEYQIFQLRAGEVRALAAGAGPRQETRPEGTEPAGN